ncbi:MAG: hypothetical protein JXK94_13940 [Deltaproteobacteria bacterium]|nr:hypothetical protein [Deltaproteobacteria bacterium]
MVKEIFPVSSGKIAHTHDHGTGAVDTIKGSTTSIYSPIPNTNIFTLLCERPANTAASRQKTGAVVGVPVGKVLYLFFVGTVFGISTIRSVHPTFKWLIGFFNFDAGIIMVVFDIPATIVFEISGRIKRNAITIISVPTCVLIVIGVEITVTLVRFGGVVVSSVGISIGPESAVRIRPGQITHLRVVITEIIMRRTIKSGNIVICTKPGYRVVAWPVVTAAVDIANRRKHIVYSLICRPVISDSRRQGFKLHRTGVVNNEYEIGSNFDRSKQGYRGNFRFGILRHGNSIQKKTKDQSENPKLQPSMLSECRFSEKHGYFLSIAAFIPPTEN